MKMIIVVALALVAVAMAAPTGNSEEVVILRYAVENNPDSSYSFEYETSDGVKRTEKGTLVEVPNEEGKLVKALIVSGSVVQPGEDGRPVVTDYVANENGYQATGESIPKNPQ